MAFSNQFALSLEVTRLVPLASLANKATQAVINSARALSNSGSDIVVENDLVEAFGRSQIAPSLASTFQNIVRANSSSTTLWDGLTLQAGPGPTVERAFREPPFFSMVIQLSLLTWCYGSHGTDLPFGLAEALAKRREGAPEFAAVTTPQRDDIARVLRSCERQTSAFDWNMLLEAVADTLSYPAYRRESGLPAVVLQGAIDMFPMVQTLPEDRLVYIRIPRGKNDQVSTVCPLVVWTHHILGLSVRVKLHKEERDGAFFGNQNASEQVVIEEVASEQECTIFLLDAVGDMLLQIKPDPEEDFLLIGSVRRRSVHNWGKTYILEYLSGFRYPTLEQEAILREMQVICCAFAQIIAKHLVREDFRLLDDDASSLDSNSNNFLGPYHTDSSKVIRVAKTIFHDANITQEDLTPYLSTYAAKALDAQLPVPATLAAAARSCDLKEAKTSTFWEILSAHVRNLAIYVLTFVHILNPEDCDSLTFAGDAHEQIVEHGLASRLEGWNGEDDLPLGDDAWLQAISILLVGESQDIWRFPWDQVCLVSDRGWSAWVSTFSNTDPDYIEVGGLFVRRGSLCKNGVWRSGVWDLTPGPRGFDIDPELVAGPAEPLSFRRSDNVMFAKPFCGDSGDVFYLMSRLKRCLPNGKETLFKMGFRELHRCLWLAQKTSSCQHGRSQDPEEIELPLNCAAQMGLGRYVDNAKERVIICLTQKTIAARWRALRIATTDAVLIDEEGEEADQPRRILLRTSSCCYRCAIDQAILQKEKCFLIM